MKEKPIQNTKKRIMVFLGLFCILNFIFICHADAVSAPSVTVRFASDSGSAFPGTQFSVYRIAELPVNNEFKLCKPFSSYPVSVPAKDTAALWEDFAVTLKGYISRDRIAETARGTTDSTDIVGFSPEIALWEPGLYLLLGTPITIDANIITPQPAFFLCTGKDDQTLLVEPKYSSTPTNPRHTGSVNVTVTKRWERNRFQTLPQFVDVQLLKNGVVWDTVRLDPENEWTYRWKRLSASVDWEVVELTRFEEYTVSVRQDGHKFIITNQKKPDTSDERPPGPSPDIPDQPEKPAPVPTPDRSATKETLPQTGVIWWPIFVLAGIGLICLSLGLYLRRMGGDHL